MQALLARRQSLNAVKLASLLRQQGIHHRLKNLDFHFRGNDQYGLT